MRLRLILGKFRVTKVSPGLQGCRITIDIGNSVTMNIDSPIPADVRLGDLLTLYTEVLAHAPQQPSIQ